MSQSKELLERHLVGLEIIGVDYDGLFSGMIIIRLSDGSQLVINAEGDDMAHTTINLTNENNINLINL